MLVKYASIVFVLAIISQSATGLYFHIGDTERKCFIEEIPDETTVLVNYKVELFDPRSGGFMPSSPGIGMHVEVRDPDDKTILSRVYSSEGRLSFTSHSHGEHIICLYSNSTAWFSGTQLRVHLDIQVGDHTIDYANLAQQEKLSKLQLRIRQLLDQVQQITKEQNYQRYREERFRQTSESTNRRVLWWSLTQTAILLVMGAWQMRHLKSFFEAKKLVINRIVLSIVGLWPYQQKRESRFCIGIISFIGISVFSSQVRKIMVENYTPAVMLESVPPFIVFFLAATNFSNWFINIDNVYKLMKLIERDWDEYIGQERQILEEYSNDGRAMVLFYTAWLYVSMVVFLSLPFTPQLVIALGIANKSTETRFPFPVDFYKIDMEKYYVHLQIFIAIHTVIVITLIISLDTMFLLFVHHSCGKSAAICYKLENLVGSEDLDINLHPDLVADTKFHTICYCIRRHSEVIQFTEILDAVFRWAFLLQVSMNVIALSLTAVQVVTRVGAIDEAFQHAVLSGAEIMHLFFACYYSQKVIDHSIQISEALNKTKWYKTSMRCRRLLNFMIMRSLKPTELKAGKVYTMSMENFSALMRTSVSYFTIALQTARFDED